MRCNKRRPDPETDQMTCRASPSTPAVTESTGGEVKGLKRLTDISQERQDGKRREKWGTEDDQGGKVKPSPRRTKLPSPPHQWICLKRFQKVENSLAFGMEMLPAFRKSSPSFSSSCSSSSSSFSSLQASLPSHAASPSPSLSGSEAHKSRDQRRGPNLNFLPPVDKGLYVLLREANSYCSAKTYTAAVSSLHTALQVWPQKREIHTYTLLCKTSIILLIYCYFCLSFYSCT